MARLLYQGLPAFEFLWDEASKLYKTVSNWNIAFRKYESFPHPNLSFHCGKQPLPRLLKVYPCAKEQIVSFGVTNLVNLLIEAVYQFILSTVVPRLANLWRKESVNAVTSSTASNPSTKTNENDDIISLFLRAHRFKNFSFSTSWRWMQLLGFDYDNRRKSYYVDGHKREDVVAHRHSFCKNYLTMLEPYCRRWIQVPLREAATIKTLDTNIGHHYFDIISNENRVEFHVDYWRSCIVEQLKKTSEVTPLHQEIEATTSIQKSVSVRPLMIVGQDESVFSQYLLSSKQWIGPKGQVALLPKSEGDGYMLSAFVSREFGFGRLMTEDELAQVNMRRQTTALGGGSYQDTTAVMEILGTTRKPMLRELPFVKSLFIGINNEGYWNSYHMSLQFEDVVNCLQVLYSGFDFVFLFDHSQGHARRRKGALNALNMSRNFGGAGTQQQMRDTFIALQEGYLGAHLPSLSVGNTQSIIFKNNDNDPWYSSLEQRKVQWHDRTTGKIKIVEKTKTTFLKELNESGMTLQQKWGYTKAELQGLARENGIKTVIQVDKLLPGWQGKAEGLLQVLYERGLLDPAMSDKYTLDGKIDTILGKYDLQYSLRSLMSECLDFKEEETALQYLGSQLGVQVLLTPKFHAELAGEGVEFSWGHAKAFYRRIPLCKKQGRENFKQCVRESTCPINMLTKESMEKFAARARAYICTYHHLHQQSQQRRQQDHAHAMPPMSTLPENQGLLYSGIQHLTKVFKTQMCIGL